MVGNHCRSEITVLCCGLGGQLTVVSIVGGEVKSEERIRFGR